MVDSRGKTPLQVALRHRFYEAAAFLQGRGADAGSLLRSNFDAGQRDQNTGAAILAFASGSHLHGVANILLQRGANPNALDVVNGAEMDRYLNWVDRIQTENESLSGLETLNAVKFYKRDLSQGHGEEDYLYERLLHLALRGRWTPDAKMPVDLLLTQGADIEARSVHGKTPLQVASACGNEQGVRFLLDMGAKVDSTDWRGDTALGSACTAWQPNPAVIQALLGHGTALYPGHHGMPDLHRIANRWQNRTAIVKSIEDYDYDLTDLRCQMGNIDMTDHDFSYGEDSWYCQCLECCREHESRARAAVQVLLDAGAWVQLRHYRQDIDSRVEAARRNGLPGMASLLERQAVQSWGPIWLPPNTRRRSIPAARPAGFYLENASGLSSSKDEVEDEYYLSSDTSDSLYSGSGISSSGCTRSSYG